MRKKILLSTLPGTLLLILFLAQSLLAGNEDMIRLSKERVAQTVQKLSIPFVANCGQVDRKVKFYANTFSGTFFVTEKGEIIYLLPKIHEKSGIVEMISLKEEVINGKINEVKGEKGSQQE